MFRILLLFSGLLGGLALAQITRERDSEATATPVDEPPHGSSEDDGRELVAVMVEPTTADGIDRPAEPTGADARAEVEGEVGGADATDEASAVVEAASVEETEIEVVVEDVLADHVDGEPAERRANRRVRALVIGGIAAAAGLAIGYVVIRRVRPDLVSVGPVRRLLPAITLPAMALPAITRSTMTTPTIELPAIDIARVRRLRLSALDGRRLAGVGPAARSAVASAVASALATSLASRLARR